MENDASLASTTARVIELAKGLLATNGIHHDLHAQDTLVDAGMTSIDLVNLIIAIEAEFDLMIPQAQLSATNFTSASSIARMLVLLKPGSLASTTGAGGTLP